MLLLHPATPGDRKHLIGAEISARIEGIAEVFHGGEVRRREHLAHKANLFHANAVLARDAAAARQALIENLIAGGENPLHLLGITLVKQQNRVNVSVARMKNVDDPNI